MTDYIDRTFTSADMRVAMFAEDTFTNCTFEGEAFKCNFADSVFTDCKFDKDFKFVGCNCHGVDGIHNKHFGNKTARSSKADHEARKAEMEVSPRAIEKRMGRGHRP